MKTLLYTLAIITLLSNFSLAFAQDKTQPRAATIELDDEKLAIEADIPSVELILSFREIQERNRENTESFLPEIDKSARKDPF